jgi:O-antigen/teichoic acid export membrane protein
VNRSTRIAVNTVASYARIAVAAGAGFITLPLALRRLGTTDFGIFSVIAGSLTALLFINGALTGGAQRHIAYSLGEGSTEEAGQWFSASLVIHGLLALSVLACALLLSHWVIYSFLSLPQARLGAAMWTYRVVAVLLFMCILSTPYQALLMAKESFVALYLMAMAGSLFLIAGVVSLNVLPGDRLVWYAAINAVSDGFVMVGPVFYCLVRYDECRQLSFPRGGMKIRRLLSFSGWNLLGTLAVQIRYQGPAILFNRFFGTMANVANGIAMQVNGFGTSVSNGLLTATSPAIVKAEAAGDRAEMLFLSNLCNKYAFVLLWLFIGPVLFEMTYCLRLWLREVPADTVTFSTIFLIILLIDMSTAGFRTSVQAEGRIALYQAVIGVLLCISVPAGYLLLRLHMPASSVLWATACGSVLAGAGRIWFVCKRIGLKPAGWVNGVLRPCLVTSVACCLTMGAVVLSLKPGFLRLASLYLLNSGIVIILTWAFASSPAERTLGQMYVSRLQEALSGSRRSLAYATRRQQPANASAPAPVNLAPVNLAPTNLDQSMEGGPPQPARFKKVSILMLTHNAPRYVELSIRSLVRCTRDVNYELIVVDNASESPTKDLVKRLQREGLIQHVTLLGYNSFFARGNNIAAQNTAPDSTHLLLLNSDVEIRDPRWLSNLLMAHKPGITAYGVTAHGGNPLRVDGYCLLVDAALYRERGLDEAHEFFWSVTKFQAALLAQGYSVQGYAEHERYLHHFGGKSGNDFKAAKGLFLSPEELADCFQGRTIRVLDPGADGSIPQRPRKNILHRGIARVQRLIA